MKKLLGILGTITIAGSGMTGIVGNYPAPAKNEVNYLKRSKRDYDYNYYSTIHNLRTSDGGKVPCGDPSGLACALTDVYKAYPDEYEKYTKKIVKTVIKATCGAFGCSI